VDLGALTTARAKEVIARLIRRQISLLSLISHAQTANFFTNPFMQVNLVCGPAHASSPWTGSL